MSDADVTDASHFIPVAGRIEPVHQDQFVRQLEEMLPVVYRAGVSIVAGRVGHDDPFAGSRRTQHEFTLSVRPPSAAAKTSALFANPNHEGILLKDFSCPPRNPAVDRRPRNA